jgi:hypothetical protein
MECWAHDTSSLKKNYLNSLNKWQHLFLRSVFNVSHLQWLRAPSHAHDIQYKFLPFQDGHVICEEINCTFLAIPIIKIRMGSLGLSRVISVLFLSKVLYLLRNYYFKFHINWQAQTIACALIWSSWLTSLRNFVRSPLSYSLLGANILPSTAISNTLNPCTSFKCLKARQLHSFDHHDDLHYVILHVILSVTLSLVQIFSPALRSPPLRIHVLPINV